MSDGRTWDRLRKAVEFERVRREGKRLRSPSFDLLILRRHDAGPPRLGLAVSRRVGSAVARNRWKRLIRAYVQLRGQELGDVDLVVVPRRPPPESMWDFAGEFERLWN